MRKFIIMLTGLIVLTATGVVGISSASADPVNEPVQPPGQEKVCPNYEPWQKYDGLSGHSFTYPGEVPEGATVRNCVKYANFDATYGTGTTVTSNGRHEISHASFWIKVLPQPEPHIEYAYEQALDCEKGHGYQETATHFSYVWSEWSWEPETTSETGDWVWDHSGLSKEEQAEANCPIEPEEPETPVTCPDGRPMPGVKNGCAEPQTIIPPTKNKKPKKEIGPGLASKVEHKYTCTHHIRFELEREGNGAWKVVDRDMTPIANTCGKTGKFNPDEQGM